MNISFKLTISLDSDIKIWIFNITIDDSIFHINMSNSIIITIQTPLLEWIINNPRWMLSSNTFFRIYTTFQNSYSCTISSVSSYLFCYWLLCKIYPCSYSTTYCRFKSTIVIMMTIHYWWNWWYTSSMVKVNSLWTAGLLMVWILLTYTAIRHYGWNVIFIISIIEYKK